MFSDYNNSILIAIIYIVVLMCCELLCIFPVIFMLGPGILEFSELCQNLMSSQNHMEDRGQHLHYSHL